MNILIINAGCRNVMGVGGTLSQTMVDVATEVLTGLGHTVVVSKLDDGWNTDEEVKKLRAANAVIVQTPGWWMSPPWQFKKYEDEVFFNPGFGNNDGRTRNDPTKRYGSGGIHQDMKYMISCTWNAPRDAFDEPGEFFEGRGIDGVFFPVHKTFEFLGLQKLPTFMVNDVFKNPTIPEDIVRWRKHLKENFG